MRHSAGSKVVVSLNFFNKHNTAISSSSSDSHGFTQRSFKYNCSMCDDVTFWFFFMLCSNQRMHQYPSLFICIIGQFNVERTCLDCDVELRGTLLILQKFIFLWRFLLFSSIAPIKKENIVRKKCINDLFVSHNWWINFKLGTSLGLVVINVVVLKQMWSLDSHSVF